MPHNMPGALHTAGEQHVPPLLPQLPPRETQPDASLLVSNEPSLGRLASWATSVALSAPPSTGLLVPSKEDVEPPQPSAVIPTQIQEAATQVDLVRMRAA
jgi:hypothetical protein